MASENYTYVGEVKIPLTGGWIRVSIQAPDTYTATQMLASMYGGRENVGTVSRED